MDQLKELINELYKLVKLYEQEKSDRLDFRVQALYAQIEILEALRDDSTDAMLKQWERCLLEDRPGKK
jgi:hypothetical protein